MRMISLIAAPAALLFPSHSSHVSIGKLALLGMLVTTFFLFTEGYVFPGGATHYLAWADAIVHGTKLSSGIAQREVGFPLLYILSGWTFTHSFLGITLILASFAVLISILVYLCIEKVSPVVAFYMGLACIISLSPYTYLKFFYPDEAYIFFNLLSVTLLIRFIQSKNKYRLLYFFTLAALMASFTRTAGNLMFPVLLAVAYMSVRGGFRHYICCILIFAIGLGLYQWHRYEIFDMRNQPSIPSGKGMQILYSTYLFLGDFGYRLSPDYGPNTKRLFELMRAQLGSNVRNSPLIQKQSGQSPAEFMEKNFYAYTPEQLIEQISTKPNEEYYWNVIMAVDTNDQFFLDVAKEIMRAKPWYVVEYSMRNFWHALFEPGYATTRYNTVGYGYTGNHFVPAEYSFFTYSADPVDAFGHLAVNEMKYNPITTVPAFVKRIFDQIRLIYLTYFDKYVLFTSIFIVAAWLGVFFSTLARVWPNKKFFQTIKNIGTDKLIPPILVASALVVYEDLLTSFFCQPQYRYFHLTEPLRLVVAGLGMVFVFRFLFRKLVQSQGNHDQPPRGFIAAIQQYDLFEVYFSNRRKQWILLLIGLNLALFGWWVSSMIAHTWT